MVVAVWKIKSNYVSNTRSRRDTFSILLLNLRVPFSGAYRWAKIKIRTNSLGTERKKKKMQMSIHVERSVLVHAPSQRVSRRGARVYYIIVLTRYGAGEREVRYGRAEKTNARLTYTRRRRDDCRADLLRTLCTTLGRVDLITPYRPYAIGAVNLEIIIIIIINNRYTDNGVWPHAYYRWTEIQ